MIGLAPPPGGSAAQQLLTLGPSKSRQIPPSARASALVFEDPVSLTLRDELDRVAPSDASVLIIGETGTGKELVARYLHAQSQRRNGPFIPVNCGAFADSLVEAELFGHEKGAFTGAVVAQAGWFEEAGGGTLLLDEIGDLPLGIQVKLLRVLQEREVVRLGSRKRLPINVRVLAATNVDLDEAVTAGRFREDLYFRLNVASVTLAPLRARPGDILPLANHFLRLYADRLDRPTLSFTSFAEAALVQYGWPGNIRELENVVHRAVLVARGNLIGPADLRLTRINRSFTTAPLDLEDDLANLLDRHLANGEPALFDRVIRTTIRHAFDAADGNQVRAAAKLGVSRNVLRTHLTHLGIVPARKEHSKLA